MDNFIVNEIEVHDLIVTLASPPYKHQIIIFSRLTNESNSQMNEMYSSNEWRYQRESMNDKGGVSLRTCFMTNWLNNLRG